MFKVPLSVPYTEYYDTSSMKIMTEDYKECTRRKGIRAGIKLNGGNAWPSVSFLRRTKVTTNEE